MTSSALLPFPGLRPFEEKEDYLFFGRERHIDEILARLRGERFLAVVGPSGSGKSSLVRAGLIPALHAGYMAAAGSGWRIAVLRPGNTPIANLATALNDARVLGRDGDEVESDRAILEANLWGSARGLIDCVAQAGLSAHDNLLLVVDQFEELFRFDRLRGSRDETTAFVQLLLAASEQRQLPIYVVLTTRTDFLERCVEIDGLPEAINQGQYLVGRMTRAEMRAAIRGPVAVGQGAISHRLVVRLVNDFGDDPDQLPVLQHTLMRIWEHWHASAGGREIDLEDYQAVGTGGQALSRHAEEIYGELSPRQRKIAETQFKAVTEVSADRHHGVRRPVALSEVATLAGAEVAEVMPVVEAFRAPGRSFLMPPPGVPLDAASVIDISHEALMRNWTRLVDWAAEERLSADYYERIVHAAERESEDGLWRNPRLAIHLQWRRRERPTAAWAARYDRRFELAMGFLDRSRRRQRWWRAGALAGVALLLSVMLFAMNQSAARMRVQREKTVVEEARDEAERQRQAAEVALQQEQKAKEAEARARADAEEQRQRAETQSLEAQSARRDAEAERAAAEEQRSIAEEQRVRAESSEQEAQAALATAEEERNRLREELSTASSEYDSLRSGLAELADIVVDAPLPLTQKMLEELRKRIEQLNWELGGAASRIDTAQEAVVDKPLVRLAILGRTGDISTALASAMTRVLSRQGSTRYVPVDEIEAIPVRDRGISLASASIECETSARRYTLTVFPSHIDAIKSLITGAIQTDGVIAVVAATQEPKPMVEEQLRLARRIGVPSALVYLKLQGARDEARRAQAEIQARRLLESVGYPFSEAPVIAGPAPGDPDDRDSELQQSIENLLAALDQHVPVPRRALEKAFLMPIEDIFSVTGRGTVVTGRIERGIVKIGEEIEIVGLREATTKEVVTGVEMFRKLLDQGQAGDSVGILLRGITKADVGRGQVLAKPGSIRPHTRFSSEAYILTKDEGGRHTPFFRGYRPQFYFRTTDVTGTSALPENVEMVMPGDTVTLEVELIVPVALEKGVRFAIREGGRTVGAGVVTDIHD